ncbi:hypothetical protein GIB67_018556 [Kingdonia uniflora]|uniref:Uncharacterized protein n=1 Tax=Kingdonia uniflora TaxID=39325 RepID=A0A7J7LW80_9MAGN|nr:hypothetical protein GIB67_018556 [Kingdonia uniflora]
MLSFWMRWIMLDYIGRMQTSRVSQGHRDLECPTRRSSGSTKAQWYPLNAQCVAYKGIVVQIRFWQDSGKIEEDRENDARKIYQGMNGERRNGLRPLAKEAVITEDEATGVRPRESHRYSTIEFSMRYEPSIPASKFIVSYSFEETSSSGRGDECSVMEKTVNSVGTTIKVVGPSRSEHVKKREDKREKVGVLIVYPEGVDVPDEPALERNHIYYNLKPKPLATPDKTSLFDCVARDQDELTEVAHKVQKPAQQSTSATGAVPTKQEIVKPAAGGVQEKPEASVSALGDPEKSSLKRMRLLEEDSHRTNPHTAAKMKELERRYCYMARTNSQKLKDEYLEHTFAICG